MNTFDINQLEFLNSYWKIYKNIDKSVENFKSTVNKLFIDTNQISSENLNKFIDSLDAEKKVKQIEKEIGKYQKEIGDLQFKINEMKNEKSKYELKLFDNICKKNTMKESIRSISNNYSYSDPCSPSGSFIGSRGGC